jgi:PAS domain S-box-containing protein
MSSVADIRKTAPLDGDRFRLLVEAVRDYAIFMLDPEGHILSWNAGAQRINGYRAEEVIGKHFSIFYPPQDIESRKTDRELEIARREGRYEEEGWRLRKNGSQFWADVLITALQDETGHLCGFAKVTRDLTSRKQTEDALRRSMAQLEEEITYRTEAERSAREAEAAVRSLSARLLRLQDEERRRLGRELHDSVGQLLVGAKMSLGALATQEAHQNWQDQNWQEKISECALILDQATREVRTMSYLFYPPMLEEMGLRTAVESYLEGFRHRSGMHIDFHIAPNFGRLHLEIELALFRVLQESLTNVYRHSGSRTASIRLMRQDEMAVLEVRDEGKGLPAEILQLHFSSDSKGAIGVGLRGMNERMRQLEGKLEVASSEKGTTVRAVVPLKTNNEPEFHCGSGGNLEMYRFAGPAARDRQAGVLAVRI